MSFTSQWDDLAPIGRDVTTGGYRRYAWTAEDHALREWFAGEAAARQLDLTLDRAGNQWAWWGDPDRALAAGRPGLVLGSHLDSVPDGGAFDGPLGVVSAFQAVDRLRGLGVRPERPIGIVNFGDEEGARFGIACAGSRLLTGALDADRARGLTDRDGVTLADAVAASGLDPAGLGADPEAVRRVGRFLELHVEQGVGLAGLDRPVAVGSSIWPHGRWRFTLPGQANHAGTTRLADRRDPMLGFADVVLAARRLAEEHGVLATCGKVLVAPNGVNAIPSSVTGWLDVRGRDPDAVAAAVAGVRREVEGHRGELRSESWTGATDLDPGLVAQAAGILGDAPVLATGAGHDAGILATAGVPSVMLFVRNPTGVSHSPDEYAETSDCLAGVEALTEIAAAWSR